MLPTDQVGGYLGMEEMDVHHTLSMKKAVIHLSVSLVAILK